MFAPYDDPPEPIACSRVVTVFRCADADWRSAHWEHPNLMTLVDGLWRPAASVLRTSTRTGAMAAVTGRPSRLRYRLNVQMGADQVGGPVASECFCLDEFSRRG